MKVYVKKEDRYSPLSIILLFFFYIAIIGLLIYFYGADVFKNFIFIVFLLLFLIMLFSFILSLIKKPRYYYAKLIDKKLEEYNGEKITYMTFEMKKLKKVDFDVIPNMYKCYTISNNNFIVGNEYSLRIKDFNVGPIFVEEIKDNE